MTCCPRFGRSGAVAGRAPDAFHELVARIKKNGLEPIRDRSQIEAVRLEIQIEPFIDVLEQPRSTRQECRVAVVADAVVLRPLGLEPRAELVVEPSHGFFGHRQRTEDPRCKQPVCKFLPKRCRQRVFHKSFGPPFERGRFGWKSNRLATLELLVSRVQVSQQEPPR